MDKISRLTRAKRKYRQWLHSKVPGFQGCFPYFGTRVYFPPGSWSFSMACEQGIYEWDNVQLLRRLVRPGTWMFDVGANIGLMAAPVLSAVRDCKVLSFEPSPNSAPSLEKTIAGSSYGDRWRLVRKAAGASVGETEFCVSPQQASYYDGVVNTHRVEGGKSVKVATTTLDTEWIALGRPEVSVIKIDVEGWETEVLKGAGELMRVQRPRILLEWNATNLKAAGVDQHSLLEIAAAANYRVFTVQEFMEIANSAVLEMQMLRGESFLLAAE